MSIVPHARGDASPPEAAGRAALRALWEHLYAGVRHDGPLYLATWSGRRVPDQAELADPRSGFFRWPGQADQAERWLRKEADRGREAYFCAHLLTDRRRVKANAAQMIALYVDGDGAQPRDGQPRPRATVRSSPGREQFYYRLTKPVAPEVGEQLNRRLAFAMRADLSGWDLTQVLRPPGLPNFKYNPPATVELVELVDVAYDPDELDRILPPIPAEQRAEAVRVRVERPSAPKPRGDADARIFDRMYGGKRGDQLRRLLAGDAGDYRKDNSSPNWSAAEQSALNAMVFWFGKDASRLDGAYRTTGLYAAAEAARPKWDTVRSADGRTYGEMTIGTAIAGCSQTYEDLTGYPADKVWPELQVSSNRAAAAPAETCTGSVQVSEPVRGGDGAEGCLTCVEKDATIARLRRALLDASDRIDSLASEHEVQANVIRAQRAELALRAEDRRLIEAQNRLRRVKAFSATQKDVILATARLATSAASRGNPEPVITRAMVADEGGCHEGTAGPALKVFDLPGSPIPRDTRYVSQTDEDGRPLRKQITVYPVRTEKPADIIEAMIALGQGLEERPKRSPGRAGCPKGCNAGTRTVCAACGELIRETPPPADRSESLASESIPPGVDGLRTIQEQVASIGADPPEQPSTPPLFDPDAYAVAAVATQLGGDRANGDQDYARANGDSGVSRLQVNGRQNGHPSPEASAEPDDGGGGRPVTLPPVPEQLFEASHAERMRWVRGEL